MFGKRKKRREAIRNKLREKSEYKMKSENVAIPEIHTKDFDEIEEHIDEIEQEKEEKQGFAYRETRKHDSGRMANQTAQAGDRYRALRYQLC